MNALAAGWLSFWHLSGTRDGKVASKQSRRISRKMLRPGTRRTMRGSLRAPLGARPAECSCDSRGKKKVRTGECWIQMEYLKEAKAIVAQGPSKRDTAPYVVWSWYVFFGSKQRGKDVPMPSSAREGPEVRKAARKPKPLTDLSMRTTSSRHRSSSRRSPHGNATKLKSRTGQWSVLDFKKVRVASC